MRGKAIRSLLGLALAALFLAAPAQAAEFGFKDLGFSLEDQGGEPAMGAGTHPFAVRTELSVTSEIDPKLGEVPTGAVKDLRIELPAGLTGIPSAVPRCSAVDFVDIDGPSSNACSNDSAVGKAAVRVGDKEPLTRQAPVFNLEPGAGRAAKIGFLVLGVPVTVDLRVSESPPYEIVAELSGVAQALRFYGSTVSIWGDPAAPTHDSERGSCLGAEGKCPTNVPRIPFLISPRSCEGPLEARFEADPWENPGAWIFGEAETTDGAEPPDPLGMGECGALAFSPTLSALPTNSSAEGPTGLDVDVDVDDEGLTDPAGRAASDIAKAEVTLPEGVTINPSQAEGLGVCSEADAARERSFSEPGDGCPQSSKVGSVEVETPLLPGEILKGSLYVAKPYENPTGSLIALYMTIKSRRLGVSVTLPGKVTPDPRTGQLTGTFADLPEVPVSHFHLHFREGGRSPLVTPPTCGTHTTMALFYPSGNPTVPYSTSSSFEIDSGVGGGSCPQGGTPPFDPGFEAGTVSNGAGSYSPFSLRWTRKDGEQDITRFSSKLPPGLVARLAGTERCPEAGIAGARARTGTHGGAEELSDPSCPASSQIGRVLAGAGVGPELTFVPGSVYLAGPYSGAPLSAVGIVPAVAGPFDVGVVVTRLALRIDPRTAEVTVDGSASDPIPHILAGIPLKVRDIRAYVDRPDFTLNPTSCEPFEVGATLWGGGVDVFSSADDAPLALADRYQAASCAALGFRPRLSLALNGGTGRGAHPALAATYRPRPGDANLERMVVRLPRSAFLDQAHIRTICTRVQFAADACPKGAQYGFVRAWTPLLDEPLQGPVWLRSSTNNLPDLVFDLRGTVDIEVATRIDSTRGGIRATLANLPDAPLTKVELRMQGGKKGLIVNSRDLCAARRRADVGLTAQNGRSSTGRRVVRATACKRRGP